MCFSALVSDLTHKPAQATAPRKNRGHHLREIKKTKHITWKDHGATHHRGNFAGKGDIDLIGMNLSDVDWHFLKGMVVGYQGDFCGGTLLVGSGGEIFIDPEVLAHQDDQADDDLPRPLYTSDEEKVRGIDYTYSDTDEDSNCIYPQTQRDILGDIGNESDDGSACGGVSSYQDPNAIAHSGMPTQGKYLNTKMNGINKILMNGSISSSTAITTTHVTITRTMTMITALRAPACSTTANTTAKLSNDQESREHELMASRRWTSSSTASVSWEIKGP